LGHRFAASATLNAKIAKSDYQNRQAAKAAKKKNSKSLGALGGLAVHSLDCRGFDMSSKLNANVMLRSGLAYAIDERLAPLYERHMVGECGYRTPDVVVAEAVAASIAIPGLFKPAAIPSFCDDAKTAFARYYADGGLVSNLPVWCFSEEKAAAERRRPNSEAIPIVAFTLRDPSLMNSANVVLRPLRYFRQVIQSAIFGGQTVVQEFVSDLYPIQLPSSLGLLTFDATWAQARSAHGEAKQKAFAELRQRLILEPGEWSSVLASACQEIQKSILAHIPSPGTTDLRLRAAVFEPNRPPKRPLSDTFITAYKVTRSFNMEEDTDDRLTLDAECPGVPEAFEQRQAVFWSPSGSNSRVSIMTKYERALVRRSVKCSVCVPIFSTVEEWKLPSMSRNQPLAVVALDTDEDILTSLQGNQALLNLIIEATSGISALMTERRRNDL